MKKFVMIALLSSKEVEAFKNDVSSVCPEAKCYNALTNGIRCRQEAIAVEFAGNPVRQLEVYNLLAASYKMEFPQVLPQKKGQPDRVCTFSITTSPYADSDNLLLMWERCSTACAKLFPEARQLFDFAIYADKAANTVNFQACYSAEDDFQAWQQAIADFCLAFMADSSDRVSVAFDKCKLYKKG